MKRLSPRMRETLHALSGGERSAYPGLSLGTLNALAMRGLVVESYGLGSLAMPHTNIKWRLTDAGRAALQQEPKP